MSHTLFGNVKKHFPKTGPKRDQETDAKNTKMNHILIWTDELIKLQKSLKDKGT